MFGPGPDVDPGLVHAARTKAVMPTIVGPTRPTPLSLMRSLHHVLHHVLHPVSRTRTSARVRRPLQPRRVTERSLMPPRFLASTSGTHPRSAVTRITRWYPTPPAWRTSFMNRFAPLR